MIQAPTGLLMYTRMTRPMMIKYFKLLDQILWAQALSESTMAVVTG